MNTETKSKPITDAQAALPALLHPYLDTMEPVEVKQAGFDYLETLLHHISVSGAAKELRLFVPTLHRIMDPELPIERISYMTAAYIIFMCETNVKILRILDDHPKGTAYYKRGE